jgi:hypothetical protein
LNERILVTENDLSPQNVGDGGLDIVGWLPFGDSVGGLFCIFAQCACSYTEWSAKQHSSSISSWRPKMTFTATPVNAIFIPFFFRDNTGNWWDTLDIHDSIVFDRVRMIHLLRNQFDIVQELTTYNNIISIVSTPEDLV